MRSRHTSRSILGCVRGIDHAFWPAFNTLRPRRNKQHFADDIFKRIFFNEDAWISIKISLKFVLKGPINNIPALVQIMAWRRSGGKPLSEPMMVSLPTHICVTRPQWVNPSMVMGSRLPGVRFSIIAWLPAKVMWNYFLYLSPTMCLIWTMWRSNI